MIHTLRVYAQGVTHDATGSPIFTDLPPVTVSGMMQQLSSREAGGSGLNIMNSFVFGTKFDWKFGAVTYVEWLDELDSEGNPRKFDQQGSPIPRRMGRPTDHTVVYLVERGAAL
jgi:hypothetical protein